MEQRRYLEAADKWMNQLTKGAFLTVRVDEAINTMTIGWAMLGYIWRKEVFMVAVRDSRHTFKLLEKTDNFTVTIPRDDTYKEAVMFCGTKSGRDVDKFKECGLSLQESREVDAPLIDIPGLHYECRIIYKSAMNEVFLDAGLDRLYPDKDYHTLYFGEILACYETP